MLLVLIPLICRQSRFYLSGREITANVPGINLSGLKCCCVKIIRYQEQCSYLSVMPNLAFQQSQAPEADSGVDMALPHSVQGAKSGDETHVAMNFFLVKRLCYFIILFRS